MLQMGKKRESSMERRKEKKEREKCASVRFTCVPNGGARNTVVSENPDAGYPDGNWVNFAKSEFLRSDIYLHSK